jgi:hypothetical protein
MWIMNPGKGEMGESNNIVVGGRARVFWRGVLLLTACVAQLGSFKALWVQLTVRPTSELA